jgi:SEC-C motif
MDRDRTSRNDPCPCGSGKKYKHCCLKKAVAASQPPPSPTITDMRGRPRDRPQFPVGTVAHYGPDDVTTTKIAAAVITAPNAEPILRRWVATDVTTNPKVQQEIKDFFSEHGVKSVAVSAGNMGCPHEEEEDFPLGEDCPFCPFWAGKQGSNRRD